jgi:hypothetical protein
MNVMNPMAGGKKLSLNGMFGLAALAFLMWVIPVTQPLLIPLIYLNTHIHEFCHAIIALGTGGSVQYIKVFTNGSGVTPVSGGNLLLIASAGYVGSAISGGWLVACCRSEKNAKNALIGLGGMMVLSMIVFVRGDLVGLLSGAAWAAVLLWAQGKGRVADRTCCVFRLSRLPHRWVGLAQSSANHNFNVRQQRCRDYGEHHPHPSGGLGHFVVHPEYHCHCGWLENRSQI